VNHDSRLALPGHPGALLGDAPDVEVDPDMVAEVLLRPGPLTHWG
jgi:hypothetical protein